MRSSTANGGPARAPSQHGIQSSGEILEAAPIGFGRTTPDGRILYANAAFVEILGYDSAEDVLTLDVARDIYADQTQRASIVATLNDSTRPLRREIEFKRRDGSVVWVEVQARAVLDAEGRVLHYESFVTDVSERVLSESALRESEERWRGVFGNSRIGIALVGPAGTFLAANARYQELVGYSEDELRGISFLELTHPEDLDENQRLNAELQDGLRKSFQMEKRYRRKDGQLIWVRTTVFPVPGPGGALPCDAALVEDITERKRAEEQRDRSLQELRALSLRLLTIRDEEAARISREVHDEIGQSLTALAMDVAWLEKRLSRRKTSEDLKAKLAAMARLVDATMESVQRIAMELRPGVLDELGLEAAIEWATRRFEERTDVGCSLGTFLGSASIDPPRATAVFRILQEALSNVARHASATRVEVLLSAQSGGLHLVVRDNGVGIETARIGDPGSLGLVGMRERALSFEGSLTIDRAPEGGTRVSAQIPL